MFGFFYFNKATPRFIQRLFFNSKITAFVNYHFNCFPGFYTFLMDKGLIKVELRLWIHLYFH